MRRQQFRQTQTAVRSGNANDAVSLISSFDASVNPSRPARASPLGSSTIAGLPLELLDRLKAFPLFRTAPESFLFSIGKSLRPSVYQTAQEIIREGEDAKAMYWVVRGSVRVTSRDHEMYHAELNAGAFFGEIGILMDMPHTASIVANTRTLVVRLNKEDLQKELPNYPDVEQAIREEAIERLSILERKKRERQVSAEVANMPLRPIKTARKRARDSGAEVDVEMGDISSDSPIITANKKLKSPSPGITELAAANAMSDPPLTVRQLLKELPLFSGLPNDILHFLGVNAQPVSFPPFTEIITQDSHGRDVFFIVKGDVEVLVTEPVDPNSRGHAKTFDLSISNGVSGKYTVKARLRPGQYFGEVTSLSLAPRRTATVRSIHSVECLLISGDVLDKLWQKCGANLRQQVESEAKRRLKSVRREEDTMMADAVMDGGPVLAGVSTASPEEESDDWRKGLPSVKFDAAPALEHINQSSQMEPVDPDPFFNADLDNMRSKSRRSSLAPPAPESPFSESHDRTPSPPTFRSSPLRAKPSEFFLPASPLRLSPGSTRRPSLDPRGSNYSKGKFPDPILIHIFQYLDVGELMCMRSVSMHWFNLINTSPDILHDLDLSSYNRQITDDLLQKVIAPFVGQRPKNIDLSNCFHVTDDGFKALAEACGEGVRLWKMKSVWDVSGPAVLSLVDKAKGLEEIDLSNCRKVGDNLLARVVGWVVREQPSFAAYQPPHAAVRDGRRNGKRGGPAPPPQSELHPSPPGTVIGAPNLKRLTLSYCKHIQDRSMVHIAQHAAERLEVLDLTRCTSVTDSGFHSWSAYNFKSLRKLVLADCTYLSDQAIVGVVGGCRGLRELDLSFCCALSDTATEVLALGLPALRSLNMAFCGSAISDNSLRCIGLHLVELRYLSVRGCVRVTGHGVESVVEGCRYLEEFDVSQCKNLRPWLERGGVQKMTDPIIGFGRDIRFDTIADGTWRVGAR